MLVGLGACLAAFTGWRYARVSAPVQGPIVLISVDALRPDHLSANGYSSSRTPAIDRLAAEGVVFERAYAHVPQSLPSHASLLTGRLPFEHGVRDTVGFTLPDNERTLAEMLSDRGYATGAVVSSFALRKESGLDQGFTLFDDGPESTESTPAPLTREAEESEVIGERWLDSVGTERAFLFMHVAEPGGPLAHASDPATLVSGYDERIAAADAAIDQLVQHLHERQLYDRATIILLSDHGQGLGERGELSHGLLLGNEVLRVPLIVKMADGKSKGIRVGALVQLVDVVPTVLDLVKAPIPGSLRGRSLAALLDGESSDEEHPVYIESLFGRYHFGWSDAVGIIDGKYQYIAGPTPELYDLEADPAARNNLAASRTETVASMQRLLESFRDGDRPRASDPVAADDRERFERLGYVGTPSGPSASGDLEPLNKPAIVEQYREAVQRLAAADWAGAIQAFQSLTAMLPASTDAWMHLATTAQRAERHDLAVEAYDKVATLDPTQSTGDIGAIDALLMLKKFDVARARAERLLAKAEGIDAAAAHERLARVALGRRRHEAARSEAQKAEAADATRPVVAYVNGRIAFEQRRFAEALEQFEAAGRTLAEHRNGPLADLRLSTAETLIRLDRLSEAEYLLGEELKLTPRAPRVLAALSSVYVATGRTAALPRP